MIEFNHSPLFELTSTIQPVRRAWQQAAGSVVAEFGLSVSLGTVILFTSRLGPNVQQKTLATEIGVNAAVIVRLLNQAEAEGFLIRKETPGDRRGKAVNLTAKGRRLVCKIEKQLMELRTELLRDVPRQDIQTATHILRLLEKRCLAYTADNVKSKKEQN